MASGTCQGPQVRVLDLAEAQRPRQGVDRRERWADRPPLLQADIPVDADAGEFGYLLASQADRPPAAACRQPHGLGAEPLSS